MSKQKPEPVVIVVQHQFQASPERVFDAFLDPKKAGQFMFATEKGQMVKAEIDARVGGRFNFTDRRNGEDVEHVGQYLEIIRPKRIVMTLGVPKYAQNSEDVGRLTIDIEATAKGSLLTLTHEMAAENRDFLGRTREGWEGILDKFAEVLGEPAAKPLYVDQSITIEAPAKKVWQVLTDAKLSQEWIHAWWPGAEQRSSWELGSTVSWFDGSDLGAEGFVKAAKPYEFLKFSFRPQMPGAQKHYMSYTLDEKAGVTKLSVHIGNFGDSPEHEQCYPGAKESWEKSLPIIKALAERKA